MLPDSYALQYADLIMSASQAEIEADCTLSGRLILARERDVVVSFAPFDYVNNRASLVFVGITPGRRQAVDALITFRAALLAGATVEDASRKAKAQASFAGSMRSNLARMFDHVGLHDYLGIASCTSLFTDHAEFVHYTSALRYPVWVRGENYSGQPRVGALASLSGMISKYLADEARLLQSAVWIPLGPIPAAALEVIVGMGLLNPKRILSGFPHASGANAERIAYFLQLKTRRSLSNKTRPEKIDNSRALLLSRISELRSGPPIGLS